MSNRENRLALVGGLVVIQIFFRPQRLVPWVKEIWSAGLSLGGIRGVSS